LEKFDFIICGTGCSGLLLAHYINLSPGLSGKKVLLIDNRVSPCQGHTFGFWDKGENEFDPIVTAKWNKLLVANHSAYIPLTLKNYTYKMIKGPDLYQTIKNKLECNPNFIFINDTVKTVSELKDEAIVVTNKNSYLGNYLFNSTTPDYKKIDKNKEYITLWQHFKAWEITTPFDSFDVSMVTFMDFRVEQGNSTRFGYVLPISENKALVEVIAFDNNLSDTGSFDILLRDYIANILKIDNYEINYTESGIIPMTEYPFQRKENSHLINIGLRGGMVSSATGYGFSRMQKEIKQIVAGLEKHERPVAKDKLWLRRFRLYNNTLLDVLFKKRLTGNLLFTNFFRKNNPERIFRFLNGSTTLFEELSIFYTVNISAFIKAIIFTLIRSLKRNFKSLWRIKKTTILFSKLFKSEPSKLDIVPTAKTG